MHSSVARLNSGKIFYLNTSKWKRSSDDSSKLKANYFFDPLPCCVSVIVVIFVIVFECWCYYFQYGHYLVCDISTRVQNTRLVSGPVILTNFVCLCCSCLAISWHVYVLTWTNSDSFFLTFFARNVAKLIWKHWQTLTLRHLISDSALPCWTKLSVMNITEMDEIKGKMVLFARSFFGCQQH